jgi:hypothetical protein
MQAEGAILAIQLKWVPGTSNEFAGGFHHAFRLKLQTTTKEIMAQEGRLFEEHGVRFSFLDRFLADAGAWKESK